MARIALLLAVVCALQHWNCASGRRVTESDGLDKRLIDKRGLNLGAALKKLKDALKDSNPARNGKLSKLHGRLDRTLEGLKQATVDNSSDFIEAVQGVTASLTNLKDSNPLVQAEGVLGVLTNIAAIVPGPIGAAFSSLFAIATSVISIYSGNNMNTGQIVESVVKASLDEKHFDSMKEDIRGAAKSLEYARAFLEAYEGYDWEGAKNEEGNVAVEIEQINDLNFLGQQIKLLSGIKLLGRLEEYVERETKKDIAEKKQVEITRVLKILRAHTQINNYRYLLLCSMRDIYIRSNLTVLSELAIAKQIDLTRSESERFLHFLAKPTEKTIPYAAGFLPSAVSGGKSEPVTKLLAPFKIHLGANLTEGCYRIEMTGANGDWYAYTEYLSERPAYLGPRGMYMPYRPAERNMKLWDDVSEVPKTDQQFTIKPHGQFYTISDRKNDGWLYRTKENGYISMHKTSSPGSNHLFHIMKTDTGKYYIVNKANAGRPVRSHGKSVGLEAEYAVVPSEEGWWYVDKC